MTLPTHAEVTERDAIELLERAVEARGPKHKYPAKPTQRTNGAPVPFYGELNTTGDPYHAGLTPEQKRDGVESGQCHYFATARDAALVKGVEPGAPMCIVGFVFAELGMDASDLGDDTNVAAGVEDVIRRLQLEEVFTERAQTALAHAQEQQDGGLAWGSAVELTKRFLEQTAEE